MGSGADREDLEALDATADGRKRRVNHALTFDLFFGSSRVVLSKSASGYTITNGAHRIWLARRMGAAHLPTPTNGSQEVQ